METTETTKPLTKSTLRIKQRKTPSFRSSNPSSSESSSKPSSSESSSQSSSSSFKPSSKPSSSNSNTTRRGVINNSPWWWKDASKISQQVGWANLTKSNQERLGWTEKIVYPPDQNATSYLPKLNPPPTTTTKKKKICKQFGKNSKKSSQPPPSSSSNTIQRCRKILLKPNKAQRKILNRWLYTCQFVYNTTIDMIEHYGYSRNDLIDLKSDLLTKTLQVKKKSKPKTKESTERRETFLKEHTKRNLGWLYNNEHCPRKIKDEAVAEVVTAMKTTTASLKAQQKKVKFKMKKRQGVESIFHLTAKPTEPSVRWIEGKGFSFLPKVFKQTINVFHGKELTRLSQFFKPLSNEIQERKKQAELKKSSSSSNNKKIESKTSSSSSSNIPPSSKNKRKRILNANNTNQEEEKKKKKMAHTVGPIEYGCFQQCSIKREASGRYYIIIPIHKTLNITSTRKTLEPPLSSPPHDKSILNPLTSTPREELLMIDESPQPPLPPLPPPQTMTNAELICNSIVSSSSTILQVSSSPIHLLKEKEEKIMDQQRERIIAFDPGVKTFLTGFDNDSQVCEYGKGDRKRLYQLSLQIDKLLSKKMKEFQKERYESKAERWTFKRQRHRLNKKISRLRNKLISLKRDFHFRVATSICQDYHHIILPHFKVSQMVSSRKERNINSTTARQLLNWNHFTFKQRLMSKTEEYQCHLHHVSEHYTTKTCGVCGQMDRNMKGEDYFKCPSCKHGYARDAHAARNIFLKNIPPLLTNNSTTLNNSHQ